MKPLISMIALCLLLPAVGACSQGNGSNHRSHASEEPAMSSSAESASESDQHQGLSMRLDLPGPIRGSDRPQQVNVALVLENTSQQSIELQFRSGQLYEIELFNARGQGLWTWSDGMMFTQALQEIRLAPGESRRFSGSVPLQGRDGEALPDGVYRLRFRVMGGIGDLPGGPSLLQATGPIILGNVATGGAALM